MLMIPLAAPPAAVFGAAMCWRFRSVTQGSRAPVRFLAGSIATYRGVPERFGSSPDPGSEFFASTGRYDIAHTCNTSTAKALEEAGLPIDPSGVVFASQAVTGVRPRAAHR